MRTDQLRQRLWISAKLTGRRWRWRAMRLVQWASLATMLAAVLLIFRRYVPDLRGVGPPLASLPELYLIQEPLGNVALFVIAMIVVWWPSRPTA